MITRLIKRFEGLRLEAYRCPAGVWTIGYGHTGGVCQGMKITEAEAEWLLEEDLKPVLAALPEGLNVNRRAALASFVFNVGVGAFNRSTLRRMIVENSDNPCIADEFARWRYGGGKVLPGLVARRRAEAELYFTETEQA